MKDINEYGLLKDDEYRLMPWVDYDERPAFRIWVTTEEASPFFIIQHHPYSISLLLKISDNYKRNVFNKLNLEATSANWETLCKNLIEVYEEENSGIGLFKFDSDEEIFCIFSEYVDDLLQFTRTYLKAVCNDDKLMMKYLTM
ncbi:MAG: hypothetical protein IJZ72_05055 [Oscillospiraceae bacterium]|nr:hypothetical protein [Oscillospiraceae bacterium]